MKSFKQHLIESSKEQPKKYTEEERIAERAQRFPDLHPGTHSDDDLRSARESGDNRSPMEHFDIKPDTIHLATPHELENAERSLEIMIDSDTAGGQEPHPKDLEKLKLIRSRLPRGRF